MHERDFASVSVDQGIDGHQATGDGADRQGGLDGRKCVGRMDGYVFT